MSNILNEADSHHQEPIKKIEEKKILSVRQAINAVVNADIGSINKIPVGKTWIVIDWQNSDVIFMNDRELIAYGQEAEDVAGDGDFDESKKVEVLGEAKK